MPRNQNPRKTEPKTADQLIRAIRELYAQEQHLDADLANLQQQRRALEARLTEYLSEQLGPDLTVQMVGKPGKVGPAHDFGIEAAPPIAPGIALAAPLAPPPLLKGVNFYPSQHPWWRMWCNWDAISTALIKQELDLAAALGSNVIRTFLPYSLILQDRKYVQTLWTTRDHVPNPLPTIAEVLDRVHEFLGWADSRHLKVILGLFDEVECLHDLILDQASALAYVKTVLNTAPTAGQRLGADNRIVIWDLVNELDDEKKTFPLPPPGGNPPAGAHQLFITIQFPASGVKFNPDATGMSWLAAMQQCVLTNSVSQKVSFGVLNPFTSVYLLKNGFDDPVNLRHLPQLHVFRSKTDSRPLASFSGDVSNNLKVIKVQTGLNRPVLIGETGNSGDPASLDSLNQQNLIFDAVLDQVTLNRSNVYGVLGWTLMDWNFAGQGANSDEQFYGLFTADHCPKPSAVTLKLAFDRLV